MAKLDLKTIVILILLLTLALFIIFQPSKPDINGELVRLNDSLFTEIKKGKQKAIELTQQRVKDSVQSIETKKAYKKTVVKLESRISDLKRNPVIVRVREEVVEVDSLIIAYDSTIAVQTDRIAELGAELTQSQELARESEQNFNSIISNQSARYDNLLEQMSETMKENRKLRRRVKVAKVLVPVAAGLGLSLGAQF